MYLDRDEIETTLRIVEDRSAPGSRLIVAYHQPAWMLLLAAVIVRRLGEPIRTVLTPHQMRELLARYGFVRAGTAIFRPSDVNFRRKLAMPRV